MLNLGYDKITKDYEIVSLFMLYIKGELSDDVVQEIKKLIAECKECAILYELVKDFMNDVDITAYRIFNEEQIEISMLRFHKLAQDVPETSFMSDSQKLELGIDELLFPNCCN